MRLGEQQHADFLKWYNNKDVVPTRGAMQKMIEFYHNKGIDMLKLGCTLPNLANICLHKSTGSKFYPFTESDKDLLEKIPEDMVGGQLYPHSMCQPMPTGLYTSGSTILKLRDSQLGKTNVAPLRIWFCHTFNKSRPDCKIESNVTTGRQKKIDCFSVDGICYHCNTIFEAMGCYYQYCFCQEARPL